MLVESSEGWASWHAVGTQSVLVIIVCILVIIIIPQMVTLADVSRQWRNAGYRKYTLALLDVPLFLKSREVSGVYTTFMKLPFLTRRGV